MITCMLVFYLLNWSCFKIFGFGLYGDTKVNIIAIIAKADTVSGVELQKWIMNYNQIQLMMKPMLKINATMNAHVPLCRCWKYGIRTNCMKCKQLAILLHF